MPTHCPPRDPRLARCLWQWLATGVVACLLMPSARAWDPLLGWLWYWLLAAPAISLAALYTLRRLAPRRNAPGAARRRQARPAPARMRPAQNVSRTQPGISSRALARVASRTALYGRGS